MIEIINQIFLIHQKTRKQEIDHFDRNMSRIFHELEILGYHIIDPLGQPYKNEMTDLDANITGEIHNDMKITKILKPIIYKTNGKDSILLQRGIVVVE